MVKFFQIINTYFFPGESNVFPKFLDKNVLSTTNYFFETMILYRKLRNITDDVFIYEGSSYGRPLGNEFHIVRANTVIKDSLRARQGTI